MPSKVPVTTVVSRSGPSDVSFESVKASFSALSSPAVSRMSWNLCNKRWTWRATPAAVYPWPTQSARTTRAVLSLQENTAERSPPLSPPEGTAMTSLSNPARSSERCALSLPAHSSMQPKGRITVLVQSNCWDSTFLNFILVSMLDGLFWVHSLSMSQDLASRSARAFNPAGTQDRNHAPPASISLFL